jgi:hypothetical protein
MKKTLLTLSLIVAGIGATFGQSKIWKPYNINVDTSWGVRYISAIDTNSIWGIAYDNSNAAGNVNTFVRTTNGGLSFRKGNIFPNDSTFSISNISAVDTSIAYIAAYDVAGDGTSGRIMKTIDGGLTWKVASDTTTMFVGGANFPDFVTFWDKNNGLALGDPNGNTGGGAITYFEIYRTNNGGTNWTRVPDANIPKTKAGEAGLTNSFTVLGKHIWFGTSAGHVYSSLDSGKTWTVNTGNIGAAGGISALAFRDSLNGLVLGTSVANNANNVLSKTIDGGKTWAAQVIDPIKTGMTDICTVPGRNAYMSVGATSNNIPFVTSVSYDDATTWNLLDSGSTFAYFMQEAVMFDSLHGWAGTISDGSLPLGKNGMDKYRGPKIILACPIEINATKSIICLNDSTTLTANGATTYTWTTVGTFTANLNAASVTLHPSTSTVYTVTGTVGACTSSKTDSIMVNQIVNPTLTISANDTVCTGGTTIINATGNATTYTWTPKTGLAAPTNTTSVWATPTVTTVYTIQGNVGACYTTASHTVTVLSTISPTLTVNSATVCAGTTATVSVSGYNSYTWTPAAGLNASTGATVTGSPTVSTNYVVAASSGACKTVGKARITVNAIPVVTVNSFTTCANGTVTVIAGGGTTYTWSPATGLSASTGASVVITAPATASTTVTYTVTGTKTGCSASAVSTLTVGNCYAGIAEVTNPNNVVMYPNPSSGLVNINMSQLDAGTTLSVTDMIGKEVFKTSVHETSLNLDLSGLQQGMYIISIGSGKAAYMQKVIIQH